MTDLVSTALELQTFCEQQDWDFCIIGGLALQFWGEQRLTKDVDITLLTGFGGEEPYIDELLDRFEERISDAKSFALRTRVLLLKAAGGITIDVSLGAFPFEEEMVNRARYHEYLPGMSLKICTAEDLIVLKAFAARDKDWGDIESVIINLGSQLDWKYVYQQLTPLVELKEAPEILTKLKSLQTSIKSE